MAISTHSPAMPESTCGKEALRPGNGPLEPAMIASSAMNASGAPQLRFDASASFASDAAAKASRSGHRPKHRLRSHGHRGDRLAARLEDGAERPGQSGEPVERRAPRLAIED